MYRPSSLTARHTWVSGKSQQGYEQGLTTKADGHKVLALVCSSCEIVPLYMLHSVATLSQHSKEESKNSISRTVRWPGHDVGHRVWGAFRQFHTLRSLTPAARNLVGRYTCATSYTHSPPSAPPVYSRTPSDEYEICTTAALCCMCS